MKIEQIQELIFDTDKEIVTASLSSPGEMIMLMSTGDLFRYNINEQKEEYLFSVKTSLHYPDGGFDFEAKSRIYTLDSIVVVVNDFKRHGFVHYPGHYDALHLWREGYHADISRYPVALFKNNLNVPHIIYAVDWNHIQIMNLDTLQVLTAAKSLIEENAEERHIEFYKNFNEPNRRPWPSPYDYFFGRLELSPNSKYFLSAGWVWGSVDAYTVYEIEEFINNPRINYTNIGHWEHESRAVCWIDDQTIAIGYNPFVEGDEGADRNTPHELHFYHFSNGKAEISKRIKLAGVEIAYAEIQFSKEMNAIIAFSEKIGVVAVSLDGEIILRDNGLIVNSLFNDTELFLAFNKNVARIYQLRKSS